MRKNNGFTLIELIAVIALIALLSLVIIPSIIGLVNKNKPKLDSATKELIYSATGEYLDANQTKYIKADGAVYCITFKTLIDNNFLDENLVDIKTGEKYDQNLIVKSSYNGYKYNYEILNSGANCTEVIPDTSNPYIIIDDLIYLDSNNEKTLGMYYNVTKKMKINVSTNKINDKTKLTLSIRKGSNKIDGTVFSVNESDGIVSNNKANFTITFNTSISLGEYVIEVSGEGVDKATKNFKVIQFCDQSKIENLASPNLLNESLTPVIYDGMNWVVADTTKEWFNYCRQEWANAVILNDGVTKNIGDKIIVPTTSVQYSEVKAMLVWIPRYEYKIDASFGIHMDGTVGTADLPGQIEVKFISKSQTIPDTDYIIPPAFTWDDNSDEFITDNEHISGIWVSKFITTGTVEKPTILPNLIPISDGNLSSHFLSSQKFSSYLSDNTNVDSHMMKSSEWGAVAYLSQSIYGKYGNLDYTGANKEIYTNDAISDLQSGRIRISGRSSGMPPIGDKQLDVVDAKTNPNGTCTYDSSINRGNGIGSCGGGASTTGNITGVYDMSNFYTSVMAIFQYLQSGPSSDNPLETSGFTELPEKKYYDIYYNSFSNCSCKINGESDKPCKGHALYETRGWYQDYHVFYDEASNPRATPFFARGNDWHTGVLAGIFGYSYSRTGSASFRVVILVPGN